MSAPVVAIAGGAVAIGGRPVLRHIDIDVEPGQCVAVLGANGSGKSTLVRAMLGLRELSSGEARLFGVPVPRFRDWSRVGFVPQRSGASSGVPASVWEVVASGRLSRRRPLRPLSRTDRTAIDRAIDVVDLRHKARDPIGTLSGGQQQRALIARALAGEPDLLVLDEPTAGVDLPQQQQLADALGRLSEAGVTVVLVAHELGPMAPLVDRVVLMRDGRVAYDGPDLQRAAAYSDHLHADHHLRLSRHDYTPHIGAPLESVEESAGEVTT